MCFSFFERSYRPPTGLAAARMDVRALSVAWIPALVIEMVCCSIASWIATWSLASILSNSSMQQMPLSANIKAPASMQNSPVSTSFATVAVKPAADDDFPDVYTARGRNVLTYFRNCDLAQDGSPTTRTLMSPLRLIFSPVSLCTPPNNMSATARLMSTWPCTVGAMDETNLS